MKQKPKKELVYYSGVYGDKSLVNSHNYIGLEPIETLSRNYNWQINEHIHNDLYQIFVVKKGTGILKSNNRNITISNDTIIFVPSNTVHGFSFDTEVDGFVLTFSETFFDSLFQHSPNIQFQLNKMKVIDFNNRPDILDHLNLLNRKMQTEILEDFLEKEFSIKLWFQLMIIELYRLSTGGKQELDYAENRNLVYFKSFQKAIRNTVTDVKSVQEYAKSINITAVHLNRICNLVAGKSALEIIHDYRIAEAKKYLLNTNYTIAEVSNLLNFRDAAYFTRLFKKLVGLTPSEFKK
jgi:AraC family transcriptional activator of pobA